MANVLKFDKQVSVISALAEGSSIRSIERMTGINRNTIMNLGVRVGKGCARLLDEKMQEYGTTARHVETVPVHETFEGETIWDGEVEIFEVPEFANADLVFAWDFEGDDGEQQVTIAQIPPATSPENAVRAYIVSQYGKH